MSLGLSDQTLCFSVRYFYQLRGERARGIHNPGALGGQRSMYVKERSMCANDGGYDSSNDGGSVATSTDEDGLTMGVVSRLNRLVCLK